jgi:nucleoside-diphosphate-sugar epimerase
MNETQQPKYIIGRDDLILVTGATGFIGSRVVETLLELGFRNLRCFARPSKKQAKLTGIAKAYEGASVEVLTGNLLSREDCAAAAKGAKVIYHLAAGTGQKSFADAFMNSVVTTHHRGQMPEAFCQREFDCRVQQHAEAPPWVAGRDL